MTDWPSDSGYVRIRDEFIKTLDDRARKLRSLLGQIESPSSKPEDWTEIRRMVHSLAGVGKTYGFPTLSEISGSFEDFWVSVLELPVEKRSVDIFKPFINLLLESLQRAFVTQNDPAEFLQDPRMKKLASAVESLRDEANNESS